jgi:hypothetical protein
MATSNSIAGSPVVPGQTLSPAQMSAIDSAVQSNPANLNNYSSVVQMQYESQTKVANAPIVGDTVNNNISISTSNLASADPTKIDLNNGSRRPAQDLAETAALSPVTVTAKRLRPVDEDLRTKILVPPSYLTTLTKGYKSNLLNLKGIVFPYTPTIILEHKAEYTQQNPLHSNYAINFYRYSMVGDISITGIFTVQSAADAINYLSTIHLLRALTKGRFGGSDPLKGSPPPVCRLWSHGEMMLQNVPVAITSFKNDLNADIDYFYMNDAVTGNVAVPVKSTIIIICKPMYSRREMLDATVPNWLKSTTPRINGLL